MTNDHTIDEMSLENCVPVIDITDVLQSNQKELNPSSPSLAKVVEEVRDACIKWGFFYITGHGVTQELINDLKSAAKVFFRQPKEVKNKIQRSSKNFRGYSENELTKQVPDWKEAFDFGKEHEVSDGRPIVDPGRNRWPDNMPEFKSTLMKYFSELHGLGFVIMDLIFLGLGANPETMRSYFNVNSDSSFSRLNYYPVCKPDAGNHLGVGPHTDPGVLTILLQDDDVSSLQVEREDKYYNVPPVKGSYVINVGDMMQVWSNGLYKAPVHRVLTNPGNERFSVPFFFNPAFEAEVQPLEQCVSVQRPCRYRAVHYGAFIEERHAGNQSDYGEEIQMYHYEIK